MLDKKYRHVIWDWNGTLLADQRLSYDIFIEVFEAAGIACPDYEGWRNQVHFPISVFYQSMLPHASQAEVHHFMRQWSDLYEARRKACSLHQGSRKVLDSLKKNGVMQSILSAHTKTELIEAATEHEVVDYFAEIAALEAGKGGESKVGIGTALVDRFEREFKIPRSAQIIIGDSSHDAEVAQALGIDCALVAQGIFSRSRLERLGYPVYDSLFELLPSSIQ